MATVAPLPSKLRQQLGGALELTDFLDIYSWDKLLGFLWFYSSRLELTALGPMLCQIVVSLLPLLQLLPSKVAVILHYLIVENRFGALFSFGIYCFSHLIINCCIATVIGLRKWLYFNRISLNVLLWCIFKILFLCLSVLSIFSWRVQKISWYHNFLSFN